MPRFNLPLSEDDAFVSLMSAIKVEVEFRRREFVATEELNAQVRRLSAFLTQENSKFGRTCRWMREWENDYYKSLTKPCKRFAYSQSIYR